MNSTIDSKTMSSMKSSCVKFETIDSIITYLRAPSPPEVVSSSTTSTVIGSTEFNNGSKATTKNKKEKELGQTKVEGSVEVLASGRVKYGPITVNPRKQPSKTLFTGRRSKYEFLTGDDEQRRRVRRERNRVAATKCREKRENVLAYLEMEHYKETEQYNRLQQMITQLKQRKQNLESAFSNHLIHHASQQINPTPLKPSTAFGDPTFLTNTIETSVLPLPSHPSHMISHDEKEFNNFLQPISTQSVLTNSAYISDQPNGCFPNDQESQQQIFSMYSSSIKLLINNLSPLSSNIDSNNNDCSGLFNSAYGTSTCAQQHSSSSEDDSLPSMHKNSYVY
ncbi:hypothetical protein I4U23_020677 [Adineta vaga]|nr:hypothetical protein I4U23_020677 [Adineta vaga]